MTKARQGNPTAKIELIKRRGTLRIEGNHRLLYSTNRDLSLKPADRSIKKYFFCWNIPLAF